MTQPMSVAARRTNAGDVFDYLHGEIVSLRLLPGTRISEVEIAKQFDVSRQPVREAFIRLSNLGLLLVRPQRATVVRKFSSQDIMRARFIRTAVECEVLREACKIQSKQVMPRLEKNLSDQKRALDANDVDRFHSYDYDFHRLLCRAADRDYVFETIAENKARVDRLCVLSLSEPATMDELLHDHQEIYNALVAGEEERVITTIRRHLSRLDDTIRAIRKSHAAFFED